MDPIDRAALELAMEMARERDGRGQQIDAKLESWPWEEVAQFAASCCQGASLHLKPWQILPCDVNDPNNPDEVVGDVPKPHDGRHGAAALRRRMLQYGVSLWHPDPLMAIEVAKRAISSESAEGHARSGEAQ